jgi:hypothetical protein
MQCFNNLTDKEHPLYFTCKILPREVFAALHGQYFRKKREKFVNKKVRRSLRECMENSCIHASHE